MPLNFRTYISLLIQSPKDFLYTFKISNKDKVKIFPFDPKSYLAAEKIIGKIKKACPSVNLYLIGSTGLQIEGVGDIDLYATAPYSQFALVTSEISKIFGKPEKVKKNSIEWEFKYKKYDVELNLTHPQDKHFREQILLFNLLKNNQEYLKEYRSLKNEFNNCSRKDYVRRRMEFFNRIISR